MRWRTWSVALLGNRNSLLADLRVHLLGRLTPHQLREFGWPEFVAEEGKLSEDALGIAFEVTIYVFCEGGRWRGCLDALPGLLGFLVSKTGQHPTEAQIRTLAELLAEHPINSDLLWDWFCDTFDP